ELKAAEQALGEYKENAASRLAEAQLAVAEAEEAYQEAKEDLKQPGVARCDQDTTDAYYEAYMKTQRELDALGDGGGSKEYYLSVIVPAKNRVAQAYAAYAYCAGFTDYEIDASHAQLALAEAQLKTAQETLKTLQENNGIDPEELAKLENELASDQLAYNKAKTNLEKATMRAPFAGTILSVSGQAGDEVEVGDEVSTSTFITIVDLYHPRVEFSIDETDLDKVSVGNDAEVVFDALPNRTFKGSVIQVNPSLETESGYQVLKGIIQLELEAGDNPALFLVGMNASVEIIGGKAENALLVPMEALRDLGNGEYGVFVVGSDGKARLKVVEVGLMDATYAEIKSGLSAGDVVTTGTMETQS
ncbi:MAG: efflux RND transporter periplasmic adaptor subunit, partial [Anaerolineales bacterium]